MRSSGIEIKMLKKNDLLTVKVTDINYMGLGVAKVDGAVIFIQGGVTEDELEIKIIKVAKGYYVARIEKIIAPSKYRIKNDCAAFPRCGGCVYRHITNEYENKLKRQRVENEFKKVKLNVTVKEVVSAKKEGYRNKLQCPVSESGDIGFYASRTHEIIPVLSCALQEEITLPVYTFLTDYFKKSKPYGVRHIYIRCGVNTGEVMVCFVCKSNAFKGDKALAETLISKFPEVKSVILNVNPDDTNVVLGKKCITLAGKDTIDDILCGFRYTISPLSFYQVNHSCTELLYKYAAELADVGENDTVVDLYCGIGTVGLSVIAGRKVKKLIGVEVIPEAVENARGNAEQNGVENAEFICSKAEECTFPSPDVLLLDPPRKGCAPSLIEHIGRLLPKKIIYISCSPDTLARDCVELVKLGYSLSEVQPFNMFQRTEHVESVVCLTRRDSN